MFNVVTGSGAGCGAALTAHPQVAKVSFTGSTATGKQIARVAADRLTRVTLELGGKNPAIVLKDADPQWVIEGLMTGSFLNQGQVCAASSRIYIEAPLFDTLVSGFEQAVKSLQVGPRDAGDGADQPSGLPGPTATRWRPTSKRLASRRQNSSAAAPDQMREGTIFRQRWW